MNFPFYIAKRYLFSKKSHNAINVISAISVCGVALATLALVCTLSVFNGFQDLVATFFTAFDPELKITAVTGKVFDGQDQRIEALRRMPEVAVFSESLEENAMVQYKDRQTMAVIKGIEDNFEDLTAIDSILFGRGQFVLHDEVVDYANWSPSWGRASNSLTRWRFMLPNGEPKSIWPILPPAFMPPIYIPADWFSR